MNVCFCVIHRSVTINTAQDHFKVPDTSKTTANLLVIALKKRETSVTEISKKVWNFFREGRFRMLRVAFF